jgi:hypothetical protein
MDGSPLQGWLIFNVGFSLDSGVMRLADLRVIVGLERDTVGQPSSVY